MAAGDRTASGLGVLVPTGSGQTIVACWLQLKGDSQSNARSSLAGSIASRQPLAVLRLALSAIDMARNS